MTVQIAALVLLLLRLVSLGLTGAVLYKQYRLFRLTIDSGLIQFRLVMFLLASVFLLGSVLPVAVDVYYGFVYTTASWNPLLVGYAASNAVSSLAASMLLWKVYQIVTRDLEREQRIEDRKDGMATSKKS